MSSPLKVLEFYSGIGGMHYALNSEGICAKVINAYEINTTANQVYKHNFHETVLMQKNIEGLTSKELDKAKADVWVMSPPCQPFTRQGKQEASNDPRAKSFLNIMKILSTMEYPPSYLLMENVKGFEVSDTRDMFITCLQSRDYSFQEFLITPNDFGIPNSRLRYYLLAKRKNGFVFKCSNSVVQYNAVGVCECLEKTCPNCSLRKVIEECNQRSIRDFLDSKENINFEEFYLKKDLLLRYYGVLDIINSDSIKSCCFTKAYAKYVEGTGSVFTNSSVNKIKEVFETVENESGEEEKYMLLSTLKLRYFTPSEVAKLMCFPVTFQFPEDITTKQKYRLLGNSINVYVVSTLLSRLLFPDG